jgi:hypothetical protein
MTNEFSQMSKAELTAALQEYAQSQQAQVAAGPLPALKRPAELDNLNTPAELKLKIRAAYVGALCDRPSNSWTADDRLLISQEIAATLRGMGY